MSDDTHGLDLRAEIARIDRDRAETHKLMREAEKFRAEEAKLWREWRLAPWAFMIGIVGALIGGLIVRHL
jgi:hypothetical protein